MQNCETIYCKNMLTFNMTKSTLSAPRKHILRTNKCICTQCYVARIIDDVGDQCLSVIISV